jgi:hypothetical protein
VRILILLTLVLVPLASLACDRDDGDGGSGASCTNDATASAVLDLELPEEVDPRTPVQYLPDDENECRLRRALFEPSDFGSDWGYSSLGPSQVDPGRLTLACGVSLAEARAGVAADFQPLSQIESDERVERFHLLAHYVIALEEGGASRALAAMRHSCNVLSNDTEGSELVRVIDTPAIGDGALVFAESLGGWDEDEDSSTLHRIWAAEGDMLVGVIATSETDVDLEALARESISRLDSIGTLREPDEEPYLGEGCVPAEPGRQDSDALMAGLLTIEDLDAGWIELAPNTCVPLDVTSNQCELLQLPEPTHVAEVSFYAHLRTLNQWIGRFEPDDADAFERGVRRIAGINGACDVRVGEMSSTWTFDEFDASFLGDGVIGWLVTIESGSATPLGVDHIVVRQSSCVLWFTLADNRTIGFRPRDEAIADEIREPFEMVFPRALDKLSELEC